MNVNVLFFVIALLFITGCDHSPEVKKNDKPNIILILADDLGYHDLGAYGQEKIKTPNIDALAKNGKLFTRFYSGAPVCAPARCVLMTGKHTGHAYIRGNDEWRERGEVWDYAKAAEDPSLEGQRPIPDSLVTMAEILRASGYRTACIGKWGLGAPFTEGAPENQGFDLFFGYNCQRQAHNLYPPHLWRNREKVKLNNDMVVPGTQLEAEADPWQEASYQKYRQQQYAPDLMMREALNFISTSDDPFFVYYASPLPHLPLQAPLEWVEQYREIFGPEEPYKGEKSYFPTFTPRAAYAAMVSHLDFQVGKLIEKLEEKGELNNTIIVFTSDNGPTFDIGGADSPFFDSAYPFNSTRGWGKGNLHEGGIRVPMIVSWPGKIAPGSSSDLVSGFWDLLPTFAELADANQPANLDGIDISPTLLGNDQQENHEYLYWEFPAYGGQQAVRFENWKGIRKGILNGNMSIELYNLTEDLREENDVAASHPGIVAEMKTMMEKSHTIPALEKFRMATLDNDRIDK